MFTAWISPRLKDLFRSRRSHGAGRRAPPFRPRLEELEDRTLPSPVTWDGGSITSSNWRDRFNWQGNIAPVVGDDLVFPTGAARLSNVNDFSGTLFHSLSFSGSGYTVSGASSNLILEIDNNATSGVNTYKGPLELDGFHTIDVADGGKLVLAGVLSGSGGIFKTGRGTLTLDGVGANTNTGTTTVKDGLLELHKGSAATPALAIPSTLNILSSPGSVREVRLLRDNQISNNATVSLSGAGSILSLNDFSNGIGALNLSGGQVATGSGLLTLNGDVTAEAVQTTSGAFNSYISGHIALGSSRTITVNAPAGNLAGLYVFGFISGGTLTKEGAGLMFLQQSTVLQITQVLLNAGKLHLDDLVFLSGGVTLKNDGLLTGFGFVSGAVVSQGGSVSTIDDSSLGLATMGWRTVTGPGFDSECSVAAPSVESGHVVRATWLFTGLKPGLYRVFATWPKDVGNSTKAPYSIFDGNTLRSNVLIDQERTPTNGPRGHAVVFQQLGDAVTIASETLRVVLSNVVDAEADGANVVADAIQIERLAGTISPGLSQSLGSANLGVGSTYRVHLFNNGVGTNLADKLVVSGSFASTGALLELASSASLPFSPPPQGTAYRILTTGSLSGTFSNLPTNGDTIQLISGSQRHIFTINYRAGDGNDVDLIYQNTATQVRDLKLSPDIIPEGGRVTLHGALTDPNAGDLLSLRIDWGDGIVQTFTDLGTRPFHFNHTYTESSPPGSPYLVRVEWFDQHGAGNFSKLFVTVKDVPSLAFLGGADLVADVLGVAKRLGFDLENCLSTLTLGQKAAIE